MTQRLNRAPAAAMLMMAALALALSGCGRMADPMAPPKRQTERAPRDANARPLPEPATVNRPNRQAPIDGLAGSPYDGSGNNPR